MTKVDVRVGWYKSFALGASAVILDLSPETSTQVERQVVQCQAASHPTAMARGDEAIHSEHWRKKARDELAAARALAGKRLWSAAYYHAGMASEFAIKWRIMHSSRMNRWPSRQERRELYSHDLNPGGPRGAGAGSAGGDCRRQRCRDRLADCEGLVHRNPL
jgi:hypothetical protein